MLYIPQSEDRDCQIRQKNQDPTLWCIKKCILNIGTHKKLKAKVKKNTLC